MSFDKSERQFQIGSGKKMRGNWRVATLNVKKLLEAIEKYKREWQGHEFININISDASKKNKFGKDVFININNYIPHSEDERDSNKNNYWRERQEDEDGNIIYKVKDKNDEKW